MTVREISERTGVTVQSVRAWIRDKKLPAKKRGLREYYVNVQDFLQFCENNNIESGNPWEG